MQWIPSEKKEQQEQESKLKRFVFFKTDNGWRKEEFEKTLVKKVPLDTTPPKPHVWFDFSNVPLDATSPQRKWVGLTDEERDHFEGLHLYAGRNQVEAWIEGVPAFIDAIEAKLREKNGG